MSYGKITKKKPAKEASNIFHNIMAASVKGNPKPKPKKEPSKKSKKEFIRPYGLLCNERSGRIWKDDERNYVEQWLEKAEHDLLAAQLILDHQAIILDISCFSLAAGSRKIFKTFLFFQNKIFPKHIPLICY